MGDEGTRRRAAVNGLQDRRLDLEETQAVEEITHGFDRFGARAENITHFRIDGQVGVALAVSCFGVGQGGVADKLPVDGFILGRGQRGDGLGEHLEAVHVQADLTGAGAEHDPARLDEIAQVVIGAEAFHGRFTQVVDAHEQLQAARAVLDVGKENFAHQAHRAQPPAHRHLDGVAAAGLFSRFEQAHTFSGGVGHLIPRGVGFHPGGAQTVNFFDTDFF